MYSISKSIMQSYTINNEIYYDAKDIRDNYKLYSKGIRSNTGLIEKKKIKNYVFGILENNKVTVTEKLSKKFGTVYINKNELTELLDTSNIQKAPPLITDSDLVFFKDEEGREYQVPMRGEITKEKIYFQVKAVAELFEMKSLSKNLQYNTNTTYVENTHYVHFSILCNNEHLKELYLTYTGLKKVIETSRVGIGYKFKTWIDDIVFASLFGTKEVKINTLSKVLNVDADHLKAIMNKSAINISCLYLININQNDKNKKIYKYGYTENIHRRFKEHMKTYGDDIKLDTFVFIPTLELSKAETEFKKSISKYIYENELISLANDESYLNVKNIFKTISEKYCGNMKIQINKFEHDMKDLKHNHQVELLTVKSKLDISLKDIEIRDKEIEIRDKELELKNKEIENLKLQLLNKN